MSYIPNAIAPQSGIKTFEENVEYLTSPTSGGGGMLGDTADMGAGSSTSSQQTLNAPTDGAATRLPDQWTQPSNELSASLLSPVERGLTLTSEELQRLGSSFQEQAGPQRTWDAAGGQEAVSGLLRPETTQKYVQPTKELLQSSYKGPSGLPEADVAALKTQQQTLADTTKALQTPSGAMGMLEVQTPGITRGEAKYDVQALWGSPEYHSAVGRLQRQVGALGQKIEGEATGAADYAKQRIAGEQRIAENARSSLGSGRNVINQQIEDEIAKIAGDQTGAIWQQYQKTKDISDLPKEIQEQYQGSPAVQKRQAALQYWNETMGKYPGVQPGGQPIFTNFSSQNQVPSDMELTTPWPWADRQAEIYNLFGPGGEFRDVAPGVDKTTKDISGKLIPQTDINPYLSFEQGTQTVTPGNVASQEQTMVYNTIQELLGEAARIEQSDPYKASQIRFDVDKFIKDEMSKVWATPFDAMPYETAGPFADKPGERLRWSQRVPGTGGADPTKWMWSPWTPK